MYARGLDYRSADSSTPASTYDFQKPYMEMWLRMIGFVGVIVEKTLFGAEVHSDSRTKAKQKTRALASQF